MEQARAWRRRRLASSATEGTGSKIERLRCQPIYLKKNNPQVLSRFESKSKLPEDRHLSSAQHWHQPPQSLAAARESPPTLHQTVIKHTNYQQGEGKVQSPKLRSPQFSVIFFPDRDSHMAQALFFFMEVVWHVPRKKYSVLEIVIAECPPN